MRIRILEVDEGGSGDVWGGGSRGVVVVWCSGAWCSDDFGVFVVVALDLDSEAFLDGDAPSGLALLVFSEDDDRGDTAGAAAAVAGPISVEAILNSERRTKESALFYQERGGRTAKTEQKRHSRPLSSLSLRWIGECLFQRDTTDNVHQSLAGERYVVSSLEIFVCSIGFGESKRRAGLCCDVTWT